MLIPQTFIQELLNRVDVVDVVGRYVALKKGGANLMGLCPFHSEKSPSFSVSPSKQFYHCFGCGVSGDAIEFLMAHTGTSFVEAVQELAQQAGLQVPQDPATPLERERAAQQRQQQASLTELLEKAALAYAKQLRSAPRAVAYLKGRGLSGQIAKTFLLGYASDGWRNLASVFPDYADARLVEAGLVVSHESEATAPGQSKRYDRFRDRIMFPIRNVKGETIGFGARVIDQGEPKYLNSPETPVFSKGRELYGLFEARSAIRSAGYCLVTEGYMDVLALAQLGFANVVAALGTACSAEHVQKLFRFTDALVFGFDGDAAGRRAACKALQAALPLASDTRSLKFLFLPPEHDPDSFIRAHGQAAFAQCVQEAMPLSRFLIETASAGCDLASAEGRARMAAAARPLWSALPEGALKRLLIGELAERVALDSRDLLQLWQPGSAAASGRPSGQALESRSAARPYKTGALARGGPRRGVVSRADRALGLLLAHAGAWDSLSADEHALLGQLPSPHGPLFAWIEGQRHEHGAQSWAALRQALRGHTHEAFANLQVEQLLGSNDDADAGELRDVLARLRLDQWELQSQALAEQAHSDPQARLRLQELHARIRTQKKHTQSG